MLLLRFHFCLMIYTTIIRDWQNGKKKTDKKKALIMYNPAPENHC